MYVFTCMYIYVYTHKYIHMYMNTFTYIYIQIYTAAMQVHPHFSVHTLFFFYTLVEDTRGAHVIRCSSCHML